MDPIGNALKYRSRPISTFFLKQHFHPIESLTLNGTSILQPIPSSSALRTSSIQSHNVQLHHIHLPPTKTHSPIYLPATTKGVSAIPSLQTPTRGPHENIPSRSRLKLQQPTTRSPPRLSQGANSVRRSTLSIPKNQCPSRSKQQRSLQSTTFQAITPDQAPHASLLS
jgi:hypothetical protein